MRVILKKDLKSAKFNVVFKKGIPLNYSEGLKSVEHPTESNVWLRVTSKQFEVVKEADNYKLKLNLELTFTQDAEISQRDKEAIIDNVLRALRSEVNNGGGLAPDDPEKGDYITDIISINDGKGTGIIWDMKEDVQI